MPLHSPSAQVSGTGVLETSGGPTLVAPHSMTVIECPRPAPDDDSQPEMYDPTAPSDGVFILNGACVIRWHREKSVLSPVSGGVCTLDFQEGRRSVRVSGLTLFHGFTLAGADVATGRHVFYRFTSGSATSEVPKARVASLCEGTYRAY